MELGWPRGGRAFRHTLPIGLWMGIFAGVASIAATSFAVWLKVRHEPDFAMDIVLIPALAGVVGLILAFLSVFGIQFVYRYVTQKAPSGSARTLYGLNKAKLLDALRESNPGGVHNILKIHFDNETADFTEEITKAFEIAGWEMHVDLEFRLTSDRKTDVEIQLPTGGNAGLGELAAFLKRVGYKVSVVPSEYDGAPEGAGSPTSWIYVGEATH